MSTIASMILLALGTGGCGYGLVGRGVKSTVIPPDTRVVAVTPFENRTDRPEIEQLVTKEITDELVKRGRYKVVNARVGADVLLEGAITDFRTQPVQFTAEGRTTRIEALVSISATLRNVASDEVLWSQSGLLFRSQYDVPGTGEFIDLERVALDEIAAGAADRLVSSILEGF